MNDSAEKSGMSTLAGSTAGENAGRIHGLDLPWYAMEFDAAKLDAFRDVEWLLVDGLGGFAMGTALGVNTRRYHGLLVAATRPPVGRVMTLSAVVEQVTLDPGGPGESAAEISTCEFYPRVLSPRGFEHLERFEKGLDFCRWWYRVGEFTIVRRVRMRWRAGGVAIGYRVIGPEDRRLRLVLRPMLRMYDFHHVIRRGGQGNYRTTGAAHGITVAANGIELHLATDRGRFHFGPDWWNNFHYQQESLRGLEAHEDLFTPGYFEHTFEATDGHREMVLRAGLTARQVSEAVDLTARGRHVAGMLSGMKTKTPRLAEIAPLAAAADDFVVPRTAGGETMTTILAGYPWFADWGRDSMVSVPGLLLTTGRFAEAMATLRLFAANRRRGLVPNLFDDYGGAASFNTVDASLWFIHVACEYLRVSGDREGFDRHLCEACIDIIDHYKRGTDFGIRMDPADGFIMAGDAQAQLTWMDAKRNGVTFTPRHGKPVEINALWYHDLLALAEAVEGNEGAKATEWREMAKKVGERFGEAYWFESNGCLADCLTPTGQAAPNDWRQDGSLRPNQLYAVSLRHSPLSREQQKSVVAACERELLTPMGLRTLSPKDPRYRGRFEGDMYARDSAYHQGTVWPWLMGAYVEAMLRSGEFSAVAREKGRVLLERLLVEMSAPPGKSLGQLCEVYDGHHSPPHRPQAPGGCVAQAWSIAELIRGLALVERGDG